MASLRQVSLWLTPSLVRPSVTQPAPAEALSELIGSLTAPPFAPHVTLCTGIVTSETDTELQSRLETLISDYEPITLHFRHLEARDMFFQAIIALTTLPKELDALHKKAKDVFTPTKAPPNPTYDPHLSLAYSSAPQEEREAVIAKLKSEGKVIGVGEDRVSVAGVGEWRPAEVVIVETNKPVQKWSAIARVQLS